MPNMSHITTPFGGVNESQAGDNRAMAENSTNVQQQIQRHFADGQAELIKQLEEIPQKVASAIHREGSAVR